VSPAVWVGIALFLLGNALYVAAEFGAVGVRRSRIRRMADDGSLLARRLLPCIDEPKGLDRYVGASQIGITLTSLVLGAFAQATVAVGLTPILAQTFDLDPIAAASTSAAVVLVGLTAVQVVLGELVPKSIALQYPTETALATVVPMQWSMAVFRPFLALLNGSAAAVLRLIGVHATAHHHIHSPDEIELLIAESRDGGLLEPAELDRLRRALRLRLRTARDLMVPRDRLRMLDVATPWPDVLRAVAETPFSRLPVYRGSPDQVIGVLRVKDVVHRFVAAAADGGLDRLLRPVLAIKAGVAADEVLTLLREHRRHQGIVIDEAGRAIGLITVSDVLNAFLGRGPAAPEART
jgi:CBS domain containing-hemolysin-like protein